MMIDYGKEIKARRRALGLSQSEVGKRAIVIAALFGVLLILLFLGGCGKSEVETVEKPRRFVVECVDTNTFIYTDTETGVQYLGRYRGGITVIVDKDGKPLLANGWRDYGE